MKDLKRWIQAVKDLPVQTEAIAIMRKEMQEEVDRMQIEWIKGKPERLIPGMLVRIKQERFDKKNELISSNEIVEVVGHMNTERGYCSCCSDNDEIVEYSTSLIPIIEASAHPQS